METANGKPDAEKFLKGGRKLQGYKSPQVYGGLGFLSGESWFTWIDADLMRRDPQVILGLSILRAPLYGVTWQVRSKSTAVAEFVDATLKRIWQRSLRKILHFLEYGVHAGEIQHILENGLVHFDTIHDAHPRDCRPLEYKRGRHQGQMAGVRVRPQMSGYNWDFNEQGMIDIMPPHAWWFSGNSEYSSMYSRPAVAGSFLPWKEKRGRNGAVDSRRLWYKKCAFRGPRIRYPDQDTDIGTPGAPTVRHNQDLARELVEKFENGGVLALPNDLHAQDPSHFAWEWEDAQSIQEVAGLREYPKDLDREILIGMNIPPELVDAATVGSGYSGRAIPAQVFFRGEDEYANLIVASADKQIIRPLVDLNFGRKIKYEIELDSLAALVARESKDAGREAPAPRQDEGQDADDTGPVRLSLATRERVKALADAEYPDLGPVRLGWSAYQGPHGGKGWKNAATGEIRYQDEQPDEGDDSLSPISEHIPAEERPAARKFFQRMADTAHAVALDLALKLHDVAPSILDTAADYSKIFYAAGAGKAVNDPFHEHFGIGPNTVAVIASHVITRAAAFIKGKLAASKVRMSHESPVAVADAVVAVFEELAKAMPGLPVPKVEDVQKWLEEKTPDAS